MSPQALFWRGSEVFYQMSPAPAAQEAGEAWGDPNSSKSDKAWATANVGLHLLDVVPAAAVIRSGAQGVKAASASSRSSRVGGNVVGRLRARQSQAGFAKRPTRSQTASAASTAVRNTEQSIQRVENTKQFFELTSLGKALREQSTRTGRVFHGAPIYKISEEIKVGETVLKEGHHFYLDNLHKDHIEVFNKRGNISDVLDLSGNRLEKKLLRAKEQSRNIKDLVSYGNGMPQNPSLA